MLGSDCDLTVLSNCWFQYFVNDLRAMYKFIGSFSK